MMMVELVAIKHSHLQLGFVTAEGQYSVIAIVISITIVTLNCCCYSKVGQFKPQFSSTKH